MSDGRRRRLGGVRGISAVAAAGALVAAFVVATLPADAAVNGVVRLDQVGYVSGEAKLAYLMTTARVRGAKFTVLDSSDAVVKSGSVSPISRGAWNRTYPAVYPIDIRSVTRPGTYRIQVTGAALATSPKFRVSDAAGLYGRLVADGVTFFQTQRSGNDVVAGTLGREPSHRGDARADVFKTPRFDHDDVIADRSLTRIGGPVDVEGGWYDAGDYLKFTHTAAYGTAVLFAAQRALGQAAPSTLDGEAHTGLSWLDKMWDESTGTLYLQVGIGSGNDDGAFHGDHDLWRLPQDDDGNTSERDQFATTHRPVFRAAAPGARISPNLAGRVSAAFALAAQVDAARDPAKAAAALDAAASLYALADTANPPKPLVTALPNEFYPEDSWHDDMEFGAAEIALASQKLGRDPKPYLAEAAAFARGYINGETDGTFNLYDTSALAHADLIKALRAAGNPTGLPVTPAALLSDLRRQVQSGAVRASADIFHAGADYTTFDVSAHTFGLLATEALYRQASGDPTYSAYATQQRNWVLGANAWGTSFMIGEGTTFPRCPQHQVSNLKASVVGASPVLTGAVVNGPNNASEFDDNLGEFQDDMVKCPGTADPFKTFNGHKSRYVDDVRAWQTNEPALDMTGSAILGSALQQAAANGAGRGVGDFALKVSTPSANVAPGASTTVAVRAGDESTIGGLVALSASGMPTGVTVALAPASVLLGTEARMVVSSDPSAPPGKYEITVTGTAGSKSRTATFTLTIAA